MALIHKKKKVKRRITEDSAKKPGVLSHFGVLGIIGWSLLTPVLLCIAGGIWIDKSFKDAVPWSAILFLFGLFIGAFNAWFWAVQNKKRQKLVK